jgi:hypothetical protein
MGFLSKRQPVKCSWTYRSDAAEVALSSNLKSILDLFRSTSTGLTASEPEKCSQT